jgi:glutamate carboxypeptidase
MTEPILADLTELVLLESPSQDLAALDVCADAVAALGRRLLGAAPVELVRSGRRHLVWRLGEGSPRVLVLAHYDTVWPVGSLVSHPVGVGGAGLGGAGESGVFRGPGCFDMKAGLTMAFHALAPLLPFARGGVTLLVTADEELGSPTSRELVEAEAAGAVAALVLEAPAPGGALKTARKGVSLYRLAVGGRAAHAGLEPERGINAGVELAHQILALEGLADPGVGTTVTPTLARAGTTTNTVPASAEVAIDVRVPTVGEQTRVDQALRELRPVLAGATLTVEGGVNRPPFEAEASAGLYAMAVRLAAPLGFEPGAAAVGGGSDGNFTAGLGVPTLDGLGAVGGGAHADDEHVEVASLAPRTALVRALIAELLEGQP